MESNIAHYKEQKAKLESKQLKNLFTKKNQDFIQQQILHKQLKSKYQTKFSRLIERELLLNNKLENMEEYYQKQLGKNFEIMNRGVDSIFVLEENKHLSQKMDFKTFQSIINSFSSVDYQFLNMKKNLEELQ